MSKYLICIDYLTRKDLFNISIDYKSMIKTKKYYFLECECFSRRNNLIDKNLRYVLPLNPNQYINLITFPFKHNSDYIVHTLIWI